MVAGCWRCARVVVRHPKESFSAYLWKTQVRAPQCYFLPRAKKAGLLTEVRDNIQKLTSPPREARDAATALLLAVSTAITAVAPLGRRVCRDATDDSILACARAARADYLVTGDHLLTLHTFDGIPIIPPRSFEALFTK